MNKLKTGNATWNSNQLRLWNELATLILVAVVFLVELQSTLSWVSGVLGFFGTGIGLMLGIRLYKKVRKK
jgi:putative membrane protein